MKGRLTVIDDDTDFLQLVEEEMVSRGWRVECAADPRRGFRKVLAHPPDLILLDFDMPGESGLDFLAKLRSRSAVRKIPVILATAHHDTEIRVQGFEAGLDDCLFKPFSFRELTARIDSVLRRAGPPHARSDFHAGPAGDSLRSDFFRSSSPRTLYLLDVPDIISVDRGSHPDTGKRYRRAMVFVGERMLDDLRSLPLEAEGVWEEGGRLWIFVPGPQSDEYVRRWERVIRAARRYTAQKRPPVFLGPDRSGNLSNRPFPDIRFTAFLLSAGVTDEIVESALEIERGYAPVQVIVL